MKCQRCKDIHGFKDNHYDVQIYLDNEWPITLCDKHKNFKPNKLIVWLTHKWYVHYKFPKQYMEIHGISYKEAKLKYYKLKHWQQTTLGWK
jgi:hypothetical protein